MDDTSPSARAAQIAIFRAMTPAERVRAAVEMSEDAQRIAIEGELRRHPEMSPNAARLAVMRRLWQR